MTRRFAIFAARGADTGFTRLTDIMFFTAHAEKNSEKYGLTVYLHHDTCHIFGEDAVHVNADIDRELKAEVQKLAMDYYGWDTDTARQICGKNYI